MKDKPQHPTIPNFDYIRNNTSFRSQSLTILSQYQPFKQALETQLGQELLKDLIDMHSLRLAKIASLEATDEEKIEYKVLTELIKRWSFKIAQYESAIKKLEEETWKT